MSGRSGLYEEAVPNGSRSGMPIYGDGVAAHFSNLDKPDDGNPDCPLLLRTSEATAVEEIEKEHMFDKVVTPSDVGKLNRLVIPKQHAEKYFPLDSSTNEKGLLLNFEDRNGKSWRFRYSYWSSSQSYVMTKGWSRFVKDKKLDAGNIVSFQRGVGDLARHQLFIDWRRRPDGLVLPPAHHNSSGYHYLSNLFQYGTRPGPVHQWSSHPLPHPHPHSSLFLQPIHQYHNYNRGTGYHPYASHNYSSSSIMNRNPCFSTPGSIVYLRAPALEGSGGLGSTSSQVSAQRVFNSVPVVQGKAAARRLRLFGVNMDCPIDSECDDDHIQLKPHLPFDSSSSSTVPSLQLILPSYNDDKGKGSMSLDLEM